MTDNPIIMEIYFIILIDIFVNVYYNISVDGRLTRENEKGRLAPSLFAFGNNERLTKALVPTFYCGYQECKR